MLISLCKASTSTEAPCGREKKLLAVPHGILRMFGFPWTNPSVNSQWYILSTLKWLRIYNHDFGLLLFNAATFVLSIPDTLITFCSTRVGLPGYLHW